MNKEQLMPKCGVGIDISKAKFDAALYQEGQYYDAAFSNNGDGFRRLAKWLKKRSARGAPICIEATGRYGEALATYLHGRGYPVSIVNPARIKAYGESQLQRNKNDKLDARLIAHFCHTQEVTLWQPPSAVEQELRALTRHLTNLRADRTRERNRHSSAPPSDFVLQTIAAHLAFLDEQIALTEAQIQQLIDQDPTLRQQKDLLKSIPGISDKTAAAFLAEVPDVTRFDSAAQLAAHAGLTPRQHQSGASVHRRGRLARTGSTRLRTLLYFPALTALRWNPIVAALAERLAAKGKPKMVIVGAAMRKMLHLAYGVLKHRRPFDANYLGNVQVAG
jgi:transposase